MSGASSSTRKKTRGKQKIEIKRIENEEDRMVTFSKRKSGIIKKSSELVTLCGANVCFVVFSPAGKAFSYGHPSVESMLNKFMNENLAPTDNTHPLVEANRKSRIEELNKKINQTMAAMESEIEKAKMWDQLIPPKLKGTGWWQVSTENLSPEQRQKLENDIDKTIMMAKSKMLEMMDADSKAAPPLPPVMIDHSRLLMDNPHPMVMMDLNTTPYPQTAVIHPHQMVNNANPVESNQMIAPNFIGNDDGVGPGDYYVPQPCDPDFPPHS